MTSTPIAIDSGVTVSDTDNGTLASGTVSITGNFQSGEDILAFTNDGSTMGNIAGSYNSATGVLTLTSSGATATLVQWQAALRAVTYTNSSDLPNTATRTISFVVNDGTSDSSTATKNVSVTSVNDSPVNSVPGSQSLTINTSLTFNAANSNSISISDVDANGNAEQLTLTVTHGTLTLSGTSGLSFSVGDGSDDATMTFSGTLANINAALDGLVYTPTAGYYGADSLQVESDDQGYTGTGGAQSDTDTVNLTITATPPTITSGAPPSGTVGVSYSHTFTATGNPAPTFSLSGTLPGGLTFDGVDTISGIPTAGGSFTGLSVTASNGVSPDATQNFSLTIAAPTITLSPSTLPDGTITGSYSQSITASGGTAPYQYSFSGTLPGGLTLDTSTGLLSGTLNATGTFNFTVTATDSSSGTGPYTGSQAYTVSVEDLPGVDKINSVADTGDGQVDENEHIAAAITQLLVVFNKDVNAADAQDTSNYELVKDGSTNISIDSAAYSSGSTTATLDINSGTALADGSYALTVKSTIQDGNGVDLPSDFVRNFVVDTVAPEVTTNGIGSNSGDINVDFQVVTKDVHQFTVTFTEPVNDSGGGSGADDVTNPANYMLLNDGGDGFDDSPTATTCATGPNPNDGNDFTISIDSVTYDDNSGAGPYVATVNVNSGLPLANGKYRLYVCGTTSITDLSGNELAGAGTAGTDFIRNFTINRRGGGGGGGGGGSTSSNNVDPVTGGLIPVTGFAPGQITALPARPQAASAPLDNLQIQIPVLSLDLPIVGVDYTNGSWDLTWLGNNAGYLAGSAYPTWTGNTVLTGHVTSADGAPGAFAHIKDLQIGDKIYVHLDSEVFVYEVRENRQLLPTALSTVFRHETYSWLTLITCEDYNNVLKSYNYRRMARAVLISVIPEQ